MGRPRAQDIVKTCENCQEYFVTRDTARGRSKRTCSQSCASQVALKTSWTEGPCRICGRMTKTLKSVKQAGLPIYCGDQCQSQRHAKVCESCGASFRTSKSKTRFCSRECVIEWQRNNLVELACDECGETYQQASFNVYEGKRSFCSKRCNMRAFSRENPMRYGGTWPRWVRTVKSRDEGRCIKCGSTEDLEVHHFTKMSLFDDPDRSHFHDNLGLFCSDCHRVVEDSGIGSLDEFYGRYSPTPHESAGEGQK